MDIVDAVEAPAADVEQTVLDALPSAVYTLDLDGRITGANRVAGTLWPLRQTGSPEGLSLAEAVDEAARTELEWALGALRAGRAAVIAWEMARAGDEEPRTLLVQAAPLRSGRALTGFVLTAAEVTASRRWGEMLAASGLALARAATVDRALQELGQQARRTLAADAVAVVLADERTGALHLAHHAGYEGEAAEIERRLRARWSAVPASGVATHEGEEGTELTVALRDGVERLGALTIRVPRLDNPLRLRDAVRTLAALAEQGAATLQRLRSTRQADRRQRLEAAGEVATGVARELRNPLFGIASAAQLLRYRAQDDPVLELNAGRILRQLERLNRLTSALAEYGDQQPPTLSADDPDTVWDEVLAGERGRLESRALQLRRTRAHPAVEVELDRARLARLFAILLVNAADAAPEATELTLSSAVEGDVWRCRLANGGPSPSPEVLAHAFELFFSTKPDGVGLGLALGKRIIEDHGGSIALESAPEGGAVATVSLPLLPS